MRLLIVEDDIFKTAKVANFMRVAYSVPILRTELSYTSGLNAIRTNEYDLCILDMSLPTFDIIPNDEGYETLPYAGDLLLRETLRKKIILPTIVLTQFTTFPGQMHEEQSLAQLSVELRQKYPSNYLGCVFYADEETSWQRDIQSLIDGSSINI